jgi:ribonuclease R
MAVKCSELEKRADDAERALLEIKKYRFLKQLVDEGSNRAFDAVISKVTNFGFFVDLDELQVGGLVHVSTISRGYVRHNRVRGTLSANGRTYRLGDKVKVVPAAVNFLERKLDFALAEA